MEIVPATWRHWRTFFINSTLVVLLAVSGLYAALTLSSGRTIEAEISTRARTIFGVLLVARSWNAIHGSVFVEQRPGDPVAPQSTGDGLFTFHLTSLKPLNPANAPDPFEAEALRRIERGEVSEVSAREQRGETVLFRYLGPLRVEQGCMECHASHGYQVGQVRGGISVTFDVTEAERSVTQERRIAIGLFAFTTLVLLAVLGRLVSGLQKRLNDAEARIIEMAITDELTGLRNRRYIGQRLREELARSQRHGRRCACLLFDIDHFKKVNDAHGHAAGDAVLRGVAMAAKGVLRDSDLLGRWGGEEFLAVLPETDLAGAGLIAERLRGALEAMRVEFEGKTIIATVSLGVVDALPGHDPDARDAEQMVARADELLYRAKSAGRNRVELG